MPDWQGARKDAPRGTAADERGSRGPPEMLSFALSKISINARMILVPKYTPSAHILRIILCCLDDATSFTEDKK